MRQVPDCLQRRYKAMDELVSNLSSTMSNQSEPGYPGNRNDRGINLMCKFWNILKEDPNCDLQHAVQEKMALNSLASNFGPRDITCYQTGKDNPKSLPKCGKENCAKTLNPNSKASGTSCCNREQVLKAPDSTKSSTHSYCKHDADRPSATAPIAPLTHALGTMKEAASAEKKCYEKTAELMAVQEKLKEQITQLEEREETEVELLKEAEAMWAAMENEYKQKLDESKKRQEELLKQQKEVEASANKWRKNKKHLEEQMTNVDKCLKELKEKYKKKTNDLKAIEMEMGDMKNKIDSNTKEIANASSILDSKRKIFENNMQKLTEESKKLQEAKIKEEKIKDEKIASGNECVKEGREELAKICRVLLKKKLENEDLRAETKALIDEIDLLKTTCDQCAERCRNKEASLKSQIGKCQTQIEEYKLRCTKCHVSCDTQLLRKYCTDCPRCQEEMEPCVYGGDKCTELATNECVCMDIKHKFMNNVFDNMYTVLARQVNTRPGKAVAEQVLKCLKGSTNGKLDSGTRKKLQDFILAAVKTNLNLTIIGGAVKTRCEMDPDTYKDLMRCMTQVKTVKPEKSDKGTDSRKDPCARWGGPHECNCPNGPKNCICITRAPRAPSDPEPCGQLEEDKEDIGELSICPHKDKTPCGPLCGSEPNPDSVVTKLASTWKPAPCAEKACKFNSNIKNARCTMTNDIYDERNAGASSTRGHTTKVPLFVVPSDFESMGLPACDCGGGYSTCVCYGSKKNNKKHAVDQKVMVPSESEFKEMFSHKHTTLPITVLAQNGTKADFNAKLKRTNSGHMALDVRRISDVGEIAYATEEYPVSLIKTSSSYKLIVSENNTKPNAVLKRVSPGEMDVVLKDMYQYKKNKPAILNCQEKVYLVKLKNTKPEQANNTLLKGTPSGNYEFVLDKEFEKRYKETINDTLCDNTECSVNLSKTRSGTYTIDFKEGCNIGKCYHNAILSKSASGNIKLIVQGLDYDELKQDFPTLRKGCTGFENLYKQLCTNTPMIENKYPKQNILDRKLDNGLLLNENIRIKIQDQQHFVAELLVRLNKVSSDQYSVIFNNEAEASFICNLVTSWLGILPIQKITESYLIVDLNWGKEVKHRFGWLKISSNGKIIVAVDSKVTRGVQNDVYSEGRYNKDSGITTTCHQKLDCCDCDMSKCCCDEFSQESFNWSF